MERLTESILRDARNLPEGVLLTAKGLLHLGSRAAIDQALSRLARRGELLRVGRGLYVLPIESRFGDRAPSPHKTVEALAAQRGERIASGGAVAANALGLTTQVPLTPEYLTSGPSRTLTTRPPESSIAPLAALATRAERPKVGRSDPGARLAGTGTGSHRTRTNPALAERRRAPGAGWRHRADARVVGRAVEPPRSWLITISISKPTFVARRWSSQPANPAGRLISWRRISGSCGLSGRCLARPVGASLVFKGGTSLSKAYGVIRRFSEDVDLTYDIRDIAPDLIGDSANPFPANRSQEKRWSTEIRRRLAEWTRNTAAPYLAEALGAVEPGGTVRIDDADLFVRYAPLNEGTAYVRPEVKLEFGARSTGEPSARMPVICNAAPLVPGVEFPEAEPRVMQIETDLLGESYRRTCVLPPASSARRALRPALARSRSA